MFYKYKILIIICHFMKIKNEPDRLYFYIFHFFKIIMIYEIHQSEIENKQPDRFLFCILINQYLIRD